MVLLVRDSALLDFLGKMVRSGDSEGFADTAGGGGGGKVCALSNRATGGVCVGDKAPGDVLAVVTLATGRGELAEINEVVPGGSCGVVSHFC